MALILPVSIACGTSIDRAAVELAHLARLTTCVVTARFQTVDLAVSPGEDPDAIVIHYHRLRRIHGNDTQT